MSDPFQFQQGAQSLSQGLDSAREASKSLTKSIENIQKDGSDVARQKALERQRAKREAEFLKERAIIKALEEYKRRALISEEEAKLRIDFIKKYGTKEWDAVLRIKTEIEKAAKEEKVAFDHDLRAVRRVQLWCFFAAFWVTVVLYYLGLV